MGAALAFSAAWWFWVMSGRAQPGRMWDPQMAVRVDKLAMLVVACGLLVAGFGLAVDASPYLGVAVLASTALVGWASERMSHPRLKDRASE